MWNLALLFTCNQSSKELWHFSGNLSLEKLDPFHWGKDRPGAGDTSRSTNLERNIKTEMKDIFCWCCFDDNDCFLVVPGLFLTAWDQIVWHRCLLCLRREFYPQKPGRKYFVKFSTDKALRHLQELFTLPCIDVLIFHLFMNHVSWPYPEHLYWLDFSCFIEGWDLQAVSHLHLTLGSVWHFQKDLPSIKILPTWSTVPVMTVPWPFIEKQWSTESRAPPPLTLICLFSPIIIPGI